MIQPNFIKKRLEEEGIFLDSEEAGPKPAKTLLSREDKLHSTKAQLKILEDLHIKNTQGKTVSFEEMIALHGWEGLYPRSPEILQVNAGKLCNMACKHCHVDAGPDRWDAIMNRETARACLQVLDQTECHTVDLTGGSPELNPNFQYLVEEAKSRGKHVIERCNLTILLLPKFRKLPEWLGKNNVEIVCSLPHHGKRNTDALRGNGTFEKSIEALKMLNQAGYGKDNPERRLTIMSNPAGAFLSPDQSHLEKEWKKILEDEYGVTFDRLITLNNMPISRYLEWLVRSGNLKNYMEKLIGAFNPGTIKGLMCRNTISVSWNGLVYDCDFNQMLGMQSRYPNGNPCLIENLDIEEFKRRRIVTAPHCFGCTAGQGSSCGGATAK